MRLMKCSSRRQNPSHHFQSPNHSTSITPSRAILRVIAENLKQIVVKSSRTIIVLDIEVHKKSQRREYWSESLISIYFRTCPVQDCTNEYEGRTCDLGVSSRDDY